MPELPEVESIVNRLRNGSQDIPSLIGMRIRGAQVYWQRSLVIPSLEEFSRRIVNQFIRSIERRGKFLVFRLSEDVLLIHLRMSGDLILTHSTHLEHNHLRMAIDFDNDYHLYFIDPRKFGRVWLVNQAHQVVGDLGPEPLDPKFTPTKFYQSLQTYQRRIKPLLMDQTFIAGLGNIYADEALFRAGIHPLTISSQLSLQQAEELLKAIQEVLLEGIERNGASIDWVYRGGEFQNHFAVYHRSGEACYRCGTKIAKITVGQRSTHYCPNCQKQLG
ncbi:MAG: bifunctional DNA-formamidopyrimidine glycosylase/DNA-(apurinic or apyrimidinic site) lyase [Anaerolineales bacterium]